MGATEAIGNRMGVYISIYLVNVMGVLVCFLNHNHSII